MYKLSGVWQMYQPVFNSVLVEINDKDARWGNGNDESLLGKSFSKGTMVEFGDLVATGSLKNFDAEELEDLTHGLEKLVGQQILWNEGAEAGTTFEHDGLLYGFIYWDDIRGVANGSD